MIAIKACSQKDHRNILLTYKLSKIPHLGFSDVPKENKIVPNYKILCWIMTDPIKLPDTAVARDLWVKRCDLDLYFSSSTNKSFPTIGVDVPTGRNHIGMKSKKSWEYLYNHHANDFDFFLKADPDTFMVMENLREYLDKQNPNLEEFFGHGYRPPNWTFTYMAGGPGMILSRGALKALVTKAFRVKTHADCITDGQGRYFVPVFELSADFIYFVQNIINFFTFSKLFFISSFS